MVGDVVGVLSDVGDAHEKSHQHEQRDDAELVLLKPLGRRQRQQLAGNHEIIAHDPDADEGQKAERNPDMHADIDQEQDEEHRDHRNLCPGEVEYGAERKEDQRDGDRCGNPHERAAQHPVASPTLMRHEPEIGP